MSALGVRGDIAVDHLCPNETTLLSFRGDRDEKVVGMNSTEKHWSEIVRIREKREIKWEIARTLSFWDRDIQEDFLTDEQQPSFDRSIVCLRESLYLAFPKIASANTRLVLHDVLDQISDGFHDGKTTQAAHMLQEQFEDGVFKPKTPAPKGRSPARDCSMGDIRNTTELRDYVAHVMSKIAGENWGTDLPADRLLERYFAQLRFGLDKCFGTPPDFEKRVDMLRLLDQAYAAFERGDANDGRTFLKNFADRVPKKRKSLLSRFSSI